jgi:hypothetical protein
MANIKKTITYSIPDELYSTETKLGKKATMVFDGPSEIIMWVVKETGSLEQTHSPEEEPDSPLALHLRREVLRADSDENIIKIALLWGGIEAPKVYEVNVGPADQPNAILPDPTHLAEVYDEYSLYDDYKKPLKFIEFDRDRSWDFLRTERDHRLYMSDGKIAEDMPDSLKQKWKDYRSKLRSMPEDWAGIHGNLVRFPLAPDEGEDPNFNDPHVPVIRIADRTPADSLAISQFPKGGK